LKVAGEGRDLSDKIGVSDSKVRGISDRTHLLWMRGIKVEAPVDTCRLAPKTLNLMWTKGGAPMALDWSQCAAVESVPGKVSGAWVFRGTRPPVAAVFANLEDGMSIEEIMEQFDVTREQVTAVLDFAARSLEAPVRR